MAPQDAQPQSNNAQGHGPSSNGLTPRFTTAVLTKSDNATDLLPATYHYYDSDRGRIVADPTGGPTGNVQAFLASELSLGLLGKMDKHLWFAGAKRPARQLNLLVSLGREIAVVDRMDLHLLWDNNGRVFLKPIPRFLLDLDFWKSNLECSQTCSHQSSPDSCSRRKSRDVALGFLYTYVCLLSSENDFHVANEKRLLPRNAKDGIISWENWKKLARELLKAHDPKKVHPRFLRAELRLSRINTIHRFTRFPLFEPYLRGWRNYSSFFRDNLTWMATATVFVALVLTAMQVGLATERLQGNAAFQRASYGFTVLAILGPLCAFGLVVLGAAYNLAKDLPWLLSKKQSSGVPTATV